MRRLFYILAICALALSGCAKKSTRIEELKEKPQRKQGTFKQNDRKDTTQP